MKTTDKALIGIVVGIVLLIVVALALTLTQPTYQAENTPKGVAHDYLLALQKEEYERAHGYLSPTLKGYPASVEGFVEHIHDHSWRFRLGTDTTLSVGLAEITGNSATVTVRKSRFRGGDLFDSRQSTSVFKMELDLKDSEWKIVDSSGYFARCWNQEKGCE